MDKVQWLPGNVQYIHKAEGQVLIAMEEMTLGTGSFLGLDVKAWGDIEELKGNEEIENLLFDYSIALRTCF